MNKCWKEPHYDATLKAQQSDPLRMQKPYLKTTTCENAPLVTIDRLHMHVPSAKRCHTPLLTTSSSLHPCIPAMLPIAASPRALFQQFDRASHPSFLAEGSIGNFVPEMGIQSGQCIALIVCIPMHMLNAHRIQRP